MSDITSLGARLPPSWPGPHRPSVRPGRLQPAKKTLAQSDGPPVFQKGIGIGWAPEALFSPQIPISFWTCRCGLVPGAQVPSSLRKAPRQLVRPAVRSCLSSNKLSVSNVFIAFFSLSRVCFPPSDGFCHRGKGCVDRGERTGSRTGALEKEAPPASSCRGKTRRGQRLRRGLPDLPTRGAAPSCDLEESSAEGPARCGFREAGPPLPFPPSSLQHQEKRESWKWHIRDPGCQMGRPAGREHQRRRPGWGSGDSV